ncbi:sure-like protein [Xylariaceae sp. FL0804]|nr:sure-like protein [Xylariaceae sp. FL0804]
MRLQVVVPAAVAALSAGAASAPAASLAAAANSTGKGVRILQGNDDGWAELYIRSFNDALNDAGYDVVLSAPADNESGRGSLDIEPWPRLLQPCEYDSCAAGSGPTGANASDPRLHWVNSFPVTAARYGVETFGPPFWDGDGPDLVLAGPNVGTNLWLQVPFSGTVGVATYAAHDAGVPGIAFSGATENRTAWDTEPVPLASTLYAALAAQLTNTLVASGAPYLPNDTWLNVNFPAVNGNCTTTDAFSWVLTRIYSGALSAPDVDTCGGDRLPTEMAVHNAGGCRVSVSVGDASDKTDADAEAQAVVLQKLGAMLSCFDG